MPSRLAIAFAPRPRTLPLPAIVLAHAPGKGGKRPRLSESAAKADKATGGALRRAVADAGFKAGPGDSVAVRTAKGAVLVVGAGEGKLEPGKAAEDLGGRIAAAAARNGLDSATLLLDSEDKALAAGVALGAHLAAYHFSDYFTKGARSKPKARKLTVASPAGKAAARSFARERELAEGVFFARDLTYEPANVLHPASFARRCRRLADCGVKVQILDERAMRREGMDLLLSVGQGSARDSRMVVMRWNGGKRGERPLALVGKGVCFDTGGISIKPAGGMEDMKWDMGGAAAVTGAMRAIAGRRLKRNVVGLIGLVENMPDGNATRPGDVVKSMSGQTVEIINTDAEGRLVLADVITYAIKRHKPAKIVDLATLTGAIIVALGKEHAGMFANDDKLADALARAAGDTGERVWRMPLGKEYDALLKSHIADMKNIGGRWGGSITAACFLERFVDGVPWAHLDIAGMAWSDKPRPTVPTGGTGFGVRLLTRLVENGA